MSYEPDTTSRDIALDAKYEEQARRAWEDPDENLIQQEESRYLNGLLGRS